MPIFFYDTYAYLGALHGLACFFLYGLPSNGIARSTNECNINVSITPPLDRNACLLIVQLL